LEIPEQTIPTRHSKASKDLEEDDEADPIRRVQEIPEQTIDTAASSSAKDGFQPRDLEENTKRGTAVGNEVFDDKDAVTFGGVETDAPESGEQIEASHLWGTPNQFLSDNLPLRNPLLFNRGRKPHETPRADGKLHYDSADHQDEGIKFTTGGLQINIHQNHAKNFLDASRVQVGTSLLGPHSGKESHVARYRVKFIHPFVKRPIVLVTTVPEGAEKQNDIGPHPDVFAASVSEIRLDHFVVNVVRVDSFPNNGWGQSLYLDWIAMEYESDYPQATTGKPYLMTHPAHEDFEQQISKPEASATKATVEHEVSDWDN
jgi:hypothetical protein